MSTTPVRITLRAYEWGIIADILEYASEDWDKLDRPIAAKTAAKWSSFLNDKVEGK